MEVKFCKYCNIEHPLIKDWWNICNGKLSVCKIYAKYRHSIYVSKNKDKIKSMRREWLSYNTERDRASKKLYVNNNKQKVKDSKALWARHNATYFKEYNKKRREVDVEFKLRGNIRTRLCNAIRGGKKPGSAVKDLGCTIKELKQYLESNFQEGMTWENWGLGEGKWSVDHIIPLSSFDLTNREQFLKACHYTNLQPLWALDNLKKGDRLL